MKWSGPGGGVPAFDRVKPEDLGPAFDIAMTAGRGEIAAIVNDPETPSFRNVFEALEDSDILLVRAMAYYGVWRSTMKTDEVRKLEAEFEPRLAAYRDEFVQNAKLFEKIETVAKQPPRRRAEEERLIRVRHRAFVLNGARLDSSAKARVAEINQRLAKLSTAFDDDILSEEQKPALVLDAANDLAGCPASFKDAARAEGDRLGLEGKWVIVNTRSSVEVFLSFADRRDLRERAFRAWTARGTATNGPRIREILALRAERAKLFGFETHAHWKLADKMIVDPRRTLELMEKVWAPAVAKARLDIAEMQKLCAAEGHTFAIEPWDHRYYAERLRRAKFDLDPNAIRQHMVFENVRDAMFSVAHKLYGLSFEPLDVPVYHPDVRAYAVNSGNTMFGVFYLDPYARAGKSSGAWMSHYRPQRYIGDMRRLPIVSNNSNFVRAAGDRATHLSWDDARTMFHEFGHALHGLLSDVRFIYLQGTAVATDYVEFPSHFHENFLRTDEVLGRLLNAAGEPPAPELIEKIKRAETFNSGFATVEFLANAFLDMRLHLAGAVEDPEKFAADLFREIGLPREIAPRHGLFHFAHAFVGDHYSAGYYSYLWSDVMASDGFAAFTETGDPYDPATAKRLRDHVLSRGNTVDPAEGYRAFRGRDPDVNALLRARGLIEE
jgi:peptidyl-dipeptidase Dcp